MYVLLVPLQACWMLHYFSEVTYSDQANLQFGLQQVNATKSSCRLLYSVIEDLIGLRTWHTAQLALANIAYGTLCILAIGSTIALQAHRQRP